MSNGPRVLAVSGSLRDGSYTRAACHYALDAAAELGADTDFIDLADPTVDLPLYDPDRDVEAAGNAADLMARTRAADGIVLGSPVYHGSYSSAFRNFHDYCGFDEYEDSIVGLLVVAGGGTIASTLDHMRITVRGVHGWVMPHQVGIRGARNKFEKQAAPDPDGLGGDSRYTFTDSGLRDRTVTLGRRLAHYAGNKHDFLELPPEAE